MKSLSPRNHLRDGVFSPSAFFGLAVLVALLVAGVATVSLEQFGAEEFLLHHRAALWLASILIGLFTSALIFDRTKSPR
jgi:hypothetical protein